MACIVIQDALKAKMERRERERSQIGLRPAVR